MRNASCGLVAALLMTTALPATALGQDGDAVDNILACRAITDISARLACFDSTAARLANDRESGELMTVTRSDVAAVEGDSFGFSMPSLPRLRMPRLGLAASDREHDALAGAADTIDLTDNTPAAAADATPPVPTASPAAPATPAPSAPVPPASTPAASTPSAAAVPAPSGASVATSASSVAILERDDDGDVFRVEMTIERTRTVGHNTTVFHMTNGQVWRQTDTTRVRLPRGDEHVAEIRRAALGSYMLRINGRGRAIRVRREE